MSDSTDPIDDDAMTLDPPGSIAVVGAGPVGIEAGLYGRYLGYDVTLIEAEAIGFSLQQHRSEPVPMLPGRCLSPLAASALTAQQASQGDQAVPSTSGPMTCGQWIDEILVPLSESDLLRGRIRLPYRVSSIVTIDVETDEGDDEDEVGEIPPDFRLTMLGTDGTAEQLDAEAVILTCGTADEIQLGFQPPVPYLFSIEHSTGDDAERNFLEALRQIVAIHAQLAGRADLDLYRPRRV